MHQQDRAKPPVPAFCERSRTDGTQAEINQRLFRAFTDAEIFGLMRGGIQDFGMTRRQIADEECDKPRQG